MKMIEISTFSGLPVQSYGDGYFRIDNKLWKGPVLIASGRVWPWDGIATEALTSLEKTVDIILLGTGNEMKHAPEAVRYAMEEINIGLEPMATPQACRSYNLLLAEGRRVALAALPVSSASDRP